MQQPVPSNNGSGGAKSTEALAHCQALAEGDMKIALTVLESAFEGGYMRPDRLKILAHLVNRDFRSRILILTVSRQYTFLHLEQTDLLLEPQGRISKHRCMS